MDRQMNISKKLMDRQVKAGHRHMVRQHNETEGNRNRVTDTGCQTDDGQTRQTEGEQNRGTDTWCQTDEQTSCMTQDTWMDRQIERK